MPWPLQSPALASSMPSAKLRLTQPHMRRHGVVIQRAYALKPLTSMQQRFHCNKQVMRSRTPAPTVKVLGTSPIGGAAISRGGIVPGQEILVGDPDAGINAVDRDTPASAQGAWCAKPVRCMSSCCSFQHSIRSVRPKTGRAARSSFMHCDTLAYNV